MNRPQIFALMVVVAGFAFYFAKGDPTFAIAYIMGSGLSLLAHYWEQRNG